MYRSGNARRHLCLQRPLLAPTRSPPPKSGFCPTRRPFAFCSCPSWRARKCLKDFELFIQNLRQKSIVVTVAPALSELGNYNPSERRDVTIEIDTSGDLMPTPANWPANFLTGMIRVERVTSLQIVGRQVTTIPKGVLLDVLRQQGMSYWVRYEGDTGWVSKNDVTEL